MKYQFKTKPWRHQRDELIRLLKRGYGGLLWEPGTGKTKVIVDWASALHMMGDVSRVLIVCPKSVKGVWEDEFEIHSPLKRFKVVLVDTTTDRIPKYRDALTIAVINYDLIWRRMDLVERFNPHMVVADESHRIKKPSANRTQAMWHFNECPYRAILTGTPTPRSYRDVYAQWKFLRKKRFGTRVADFDERYIRMGGYMKTQVKGYYHFKELKKKLRKDATAIKLRDVIDLPPERMQRIPVLLEPKVQAMYDRLELEYFLELESGEVIDAPNMLAKREKLIQITGGWVNTEQGTVQISRAKIDTARDLLVDRLELEEKVVIIAKYIPETDALIEAADKVGFDKVYLMRGDVKQKDRDLQRREFQKIKDPAVFVIQIQTGGLGISLHAAHEMLFYSVSQSLDEFEQAQGRIRRGNQKNKMMFRFIIAKNTLEPDIYTALKTKADMQDALKEGLKRRNKRRAA